MPRWQWVLMHLIRRLWVRATLLGGLGVAAAMIATTADTLIPFSFPFTIEAESIDRILNILATSMLAVTTFSLSVMVSAYGAASTNVTPRAIKLLTEDHTTQNVLSAFVGSFLFSVVGIIALQVGAYGDQGRILLFAVTLGVLALVVISLLRWIDHLTRFGRVGETTAQVEQATRRAMDEYLREPCLGGQPRIDADLADVDTAAQVCAARIGYVQHIDMSALTDCCEKMSVRIFLSVVPGAFVYKGAVLGWFECDNSSEVDSAALSAAICDAITIDDDRSFDQDPRFGLAVLSEIACRALSPGVNDPGTAIDVIGRQTRLLSRWAEGSSSTDTGSASARSPRYPRVYIPTLDTADLFEDSFMLIARDGAAHVEIQLRLQKALRALGELGDAPFREAASKQSLLARDRAIQALTLEADRERVLAVLETPAEHGQPSAHDKQ